MTAPRVGLPTPPPPPAPTLRNTIIHILTVTAAVAGIFGVVVASVPQASLPAGWLAAATAATAVATTVVAAALKVLNADTPPPPPHG